MKSKEHRRKGFWPSVILVAFVAAFITFFIMLQVEKNALNAYEKVAVWCTKEEIADGVEITNSNWTSYFVQTQVNVNMVPEQVVVHPEELIGQQALIMIPKGSVLTEFMFSDIEKYASDLKDPVVAGCKADDLFQMVSGVLRKGDLVHVYTVNEELGQTYLLWENVLVYQVFDAAGNVIAPENDNIPAARVNVLLEKGWTEQFYNELSNDSLRVVKVWEESGQGGI